MNRLHSLSRAEVRRENLGAGQFICPSIYYPRVPGLPMANWVQGPCGQYIQQPLRRHGRGRVAEAEMIFAALSGNGAGGGAPEGEGP